MDGVFRAADLTINSKPYGQAINSPPQLTRPSSNRRKLSGSEDEENEENRRRGEQLLSVREAGGRDLPNSPVGQQRASPPRAGQQHDSRHIMFIGREPCPKTERTRKQGSRRGEENIVFHLRLLGRIRLQESSRRLLHVLVCERMERGEED